MFLVAVAAVLACIAAFVSVYLAYLLTVIPILIAARKCIQAKKEGMHAHDFSAVLSYSRIWDFHQPLNFKRKPGLFRGFVAPAVHGGSEVDIYLDFVAKSPKGAK